MHFDHFSQRAQRNLTTKQNRLPQMPKQNPVATKQRVTEKPIVSAKHTPDNPKKTVSQLQLEIQKLKQMQNQLELEMAKGKDNSKEKLLHHIKTQIHIRQVHLKQQKQKKPLLSQQLSNESKKRNELSNQEKSETTGKNQETQQAVPGSELLQTLNKTKDFRRQHMSRQAKANNIKKINDTPQLPEAMALQQTHQQQDSRNFIPTDSLRQVHNSNGVQYTHNKHMQLPPPPPPPPQPQQQYHLRQTFPEKIMQHQTIETAPLRQEQVNLIGQPAISMNRAIYQPGTQQILVPINTLPVNNVYSSQVLPNERIIVIEAVSDKYGQKRGTESSLVVNSGQEIIQKVPLPTKSTQTLQTNPVTTTTSPTTASAITPTASSTTTTAAAASSSHTTMPTPPTTYRCVCFKHLLNVSSHCTLK